MQQALSVTARPQALRTSRRNTFAHAIILFSGASAKSCVFSRNLTCQSPLVATATAERSVLPVEDVDRSYCDNFQCTSSPQIEQTVKAFARDIEKLRFTNSLFQKDVIYSDGFRSFQGADKYVKQRWYTEALTKPVVTVHRLRMLDKGTAQVEWSVKGSMGAMPVDIGVTTTITMNLLTGRIEKHTESWSLARLPPPAQMAVTASRVAWSARVGSSEMSEKLQKTVTESLTSFDDAESPSFYHNPTDPTRFFQNNNTEKQDYLAYGLAIALLYLAYRAWTEIMQL